MVSFAKDQWSDGDQLWWTGAKPGDRLSVEIPDVEAGEYSIELVLTQAADYGIVQLWLDGEKLGEPIDLYHGPAVITTGVVSFPPRRFDQGNHRLTAEIVGANAQAAQSFMFGLDYIQLGKPRVDQALLDGS